MHFASMHRLLASDIVRLSTPRLQTALVALLGLHDDLVVIGQRQLAAKVGQAYRQRPDVAVLDCRCRRPMASPQPSKSTSGARSAVL